MYEQRFLLLSSLAGANNKIEPTNWSLFCVGYRRRRPWGSNVTKLEKQRPQSRSSAVATPFRTRRANSRWYRSPVKLVSLDWVEIFERRFRVRLRVPESRLVVRIGNVLGCVSVVLVNIFWGSGRVSGLRLGRRKKSLAATGPGEKSKFPYSPVVINTIYNRTERISFYTSPRGETNMKRCKTVAQEEEKNPVVLVNVDIRPLVHSPR